MYDELVKRLRMRANLFKKINQMESCIMDEAADAIEDLEFACNRYEKDYKDLCAYLPKWIPVSERLIRSGWYLVACNEWGGSAVRKAIYDEATRKWLEFPCGGPKNITKFVTHYMPLPEPPKEG